MWTFVGHVKNKLSCAKLGIGTLFINIYSLCADWCLGDRNTGKRMRKLKRL